MLCVSDTTLSIVAEIRPVDASVMLAMSVFVVPTDFVQTEDCVVALI